MGALRRIMRPPPQLASKVETTISPALRGNGISGMMEHIWASGNIVRIGTLP
jgi:hypothetical protein